MIIINQDQDDFITNDKINIKLHTHNGLFMGWNIYGRRLIKRVLLGTYDTEEDAKQIVQEIKRLKTSGCEKYVMPEASMDPNEYMEEVDQRVSGD